MKDQVIAPPAPGLGPGPPSAGLPPPSPPAAAAAAAAAEKGTESRQVRHQGDDAGTLNEPNDDTEDMNEEDFRTFLVDHENIVATKGEQVSTCTSDDAEISGQPSGHQIQGHPGAYAIGGINSDNPAPADTAESTARRDSHEHRGVNQESEQLQRGQIPRIASAGLIEANLIDSAEDLENLEAAEPVDVDALAKKNRKQKKKQLMLLIFGALIVLLVVAAFVAGVVVGKSGKEPTSNAPEKTASPSKVETLVPTSTPTITSASLLQNLLRELPNSTVERINTYGSPQQKAFEWLGGHSFLFDMQEWKKVQLFALVTFFYSFEGPKWPQSVREDWLEYDTDECNWYSGAHGAFDGDAFIQFAEFNNTNLTDLDDDIYFKLEELAARTSCNEEGKFDVLSINGITLEELQPTVPPEISLLTSLRRIDLTENGVSLPLSQLLPVEFFQMDQLEELQLFGNPLSGPIMSEIGFLTNLKELYFFDCLLTGTIPTEVFSINGLSQLIAPGNMLTGGIPSEIGNLPNLTWLDLDTNYFDTIPSEIGLLSSLQYFLAGNNLLSPGIPTEVGKIETLLHLNLMNNALTASLPVQVFGLSNLEELTMSDNQITGSISTDIGHLTNLKYLGLRDTTLRGTLPSELGLLSLLTLEISGSTITGSMPTELGRATTLLGVFLDRTVLSGPIPQELSQLTSLEILDLSNMPNLTGTIPDEFGALVLNHSLSKLNLTGSPFLSGTIPERVCALQNTTQDCFYWEPLLFSMVPCVLDFDCTAQLCGCSCACNM